MTNSLHNLEAFSVASDPNRLSPGAFSIVYAYGGAAYGYLALKSGASELFARDDSVYSRSTQYVLLQEMLDRDRKGNVIGNRVCRYINSDDANGDPGNEGIKFLPAGITIARPELLAEPETILHGAFFNDKIRHQFAKVATELSQVNS